MNSESGNNFHEFQKWKFLLVVFCFLFLIIHRIMKVSFISFFFFTELLYYRGLWGHLGLPKFRMFLKYPDICD